MNHTFSNYVNMREAGLPQAVPVQGRQQGPAPVAKFAPQQPQPAQFANDEIGQTLQQHSYTIANIKKAAEAMGDKQLSTFADQVAGAIKTTWQALQKG